MTVFKSVTHQQIWLENWCDRCWRLNNCSILRKFARTGRKPAEWQRNPRAQEMADQVKCNEFRTIPPKPTKVVDFEDVPMFDVEPAVGHLVPVEGWPDYRNKKRDKGAEHA